jgi:putative acetyltransferase
MVAERDSTLVGFVTVDPVSGYLDQLVVAPELWASGAGGQLINAAKSVAPCGLSLHVNQDNVRAIRFYTKHGFQVLGDDVNSTSGKPVHVMRWSPSP